jgi:beta-glucosidase
LAGREQGAARERFALKFKRDFLWGAATAAYQIEGSVSADGRSESIWDRFCETPGKIVDGSSGTRACDHYRLWQQDVELMKWLGLGAYRFSLAWPRILPGGRGSVNDRGLDFYDRLVDALLAAGVEPFVTIYHWDLPQVLEDAGGWPNRSTVGAFVEYAEVVTRRLGDRVKSWITHNEPWCASVLGYARGLQAPGRKSPRDALAAAHHLLLSHGEAVRVVRGNVTKGRVGIALNLVPSEPASPSPLDADAARACDGEANRWFLDPLYGRGYPMDAVADRVRDGSLETEALPFVVPGDLSVIAQRTDFLGINYYMRSIARSPLVPDEKNQPRSVMPTGEVTAMGWEVFPDGLERILRQVHERYSPPSIYVTENGAAYADSRARGARIVADEARRRYIDRHLRAAHRAIAAGVPLDGYFLWSLMDNFEWAEGYSKRFGLFWVDYETQERVPKQSAHWYRRVVASRSLTMDADAVEDAR